MNYTVQFMVRAAAVVKADSEEEAKEKLSKMPLSEIFETLPFCMSNTDTFEIESVSKYEEEKS